MKKAFTLIELLVVIAIIAILAAILFPVFAQAKQAAKKAASLSNNKQIALSALMYSNDYDDGTPLFVNGHYADMLAAKVGVNSWVLTCQPYIKNLQLMVDPLGSDPDNIFGSGSFAWYYNWNFFPHYGYNYIFLSPWIQCDTSNSVTTSGGATPAATPIFTESWDFSASSQFGYFTATAPGGFYGTQNTSGADECVWTGSGWAEFPSANPTVPYTAEVAFRSTSSTTTSFLDGHTKSMKDTALAAGTDYATSKDPNNTKIIDTTTYIWSYNGDYSFNH